MSVFDQSRPSGTPWMCACFLGCFALFGAHSAQASKPLHPRAVLLRNNYEQAIQAQELYGLRIGKVQSPAGDHRLITADHAQRHDQINQTFVALMRNHIGVVTHYDIQSQRFAKLTPSVDQVVNMIISNPHDATGIRDVVHKAIRDQFGLTVDETSPVAQFKPICVGGLCRIKAWTPAIAETTRSGTSEVLPGKPGFVTFFDVPIERRLREGTFETPGPQDVHPIGTLHKVVLTADQIHMVMKSMMPGEIFDAIELYSEDLDELDNMMLQEHGVTEPFYGYSEF